MSFFRERMKVGISKAEDQLDIELQNRHLLQYCLSKGTTIIFHGKGKYTITPAEKLTREMVANSKGFTIPDRILQKDSKTEPMYLDGEVHEKRGVKNRDERIDSLLESCGLEPHRFAYKGRLSKRRLKEICDKIEEVVL